MTDKTISQRLKSARKQQGLSQAKLAKKAGLNKNVIAKIEQGVSKQPTLATVKKLSKALGVKSSELLVGLGWKKNEEKIFLACFYSGYPGLLLCRRKWYTS